MRRTAVLRPALGVALIAGVAACAERAILEPTEEPTSTPAVEQLARWSDPATWPDGMVPTAGAAVLIPTGKAVLLDVSPPALGTLRIDGSLVFDERDLSLSADQIMVHGKLQVGTEEKPFTHRAVITLTGGDVAASSKMLGVMQGTLDLHGEPRLSWTRLAATAMAGARQIVLSEDHDWRAGDRLVIGSTDYHPAYAEEVMVKSVSGRTIELEMPLMYPHYGELQSYDGRTLDERAEVALLSRNIQIRGDEASRSTGFGGNLMIMAGSMARIEGAELYLMGQKAKLARYALHWHVAGVMDGNYARNNSIWKSFNRCITIHGTHNVALERNVCYDHVGHGYFLEDGNETGNRLVGNLGLRTVAPARGEAILTSDAMPGTYWITNPDNTFRDNVAAGSYGFGFLMPLPEHPTGLSANPNIWPRETALREFRGNVAHSNIMGGLWVDGAGKADGSTEVVRYTPPTQAVFADFTAYKHGVAAIWVRGSNMTFTNALLADNRLGATLTASDSYLKRSVMIGESANQGMWAPMDTHGFEMYDGTVGVEDVTFINFMDSPSRRSGALTYKSQNHFPSRPTNYVERVRFVNANRFHFRDAAPTFDGDKNSVLIDRDGSLSGSAGSRVVALNPVLITPACKAASQWNGSLCPNEYANLRIKSPGKQVGEVVVRRDDGASVTLDGRSFDAQVIDALLLVNRSFSLEFVGGTPGRVQLLLTDLPADGAVDVSIAYPTMDFTVHSNGSKYMYDRATGRLNVHLVRDPSTGTAYVEIVPR